jgi:catechol 2,3-dioxygenase-like lactoylglutathione lyase family enzyme
MEGLLSVGAPRISLVTLGVRDLDRARRFYEDLGFVRAPASQDGIAFYEAAGVVLALFGRAALAEDAGADDEPTGFASVALAWNVGSEAEADAAMARAVGCGARILKPLQRVFWGGYSGYFADPDGHLWEVAYNPFCTIDADGRLRLPLGSGPEPDSQAVQSP